MLERAVRDVQKTRVRFGHTDPARIVYYPRFFEWFHDAMEDAFENVVGRPYAECLDTWKVGYPAVQVACEFRRPARFGELVDIEVFLSRMSERSMTFEFRVRRGADLLVTASVKVAGISMDGKGPAPIPEPVRAAFAPYVEEDAERPDPSRIR